MKSMVIALTSFAASAAAQGCSPLHYIYARATTELPTGIKESTTPADFTSAAAKWWSLGYGAAGGALWLNLTSEKANTRIEGITGYPVPYPADASFGSGSGTRSSPQIGIDLMIAELKSKAIACPNQRYVLGGHSQGGMVTVGAIGRLANEAGLPKDTVDRIVAVTMFGSPPCPASVKDKCMSYCNKGDFVCDAAAKGNAPKFPKGFGKGPVVVPPGTITPTRRSLADDACPKDVKESGWVSVGPQTGAGPHLSYNQDGHFIKAAACYINEKFKAAK